MKILSQNSKMKKSSQDGIDVYNFGIPAFMSQSGIKTCPNARQCATGCYAQSGTYRFKNVANAYEQRLKLTQDRYFVDIMVSEIKTLALKSKAIGNKCIIRIHDSGDFYSQVYLNDWILIMEQLPDVSFYAYTKMIQMFEQSKPVLPKNFTVIYSLGGSEDHLVSIIKHRHSKVFQNESDLIASGYVNASQDDMVAIGQNPKIGLVYHGVKKFDKTSWSKVS